MFVSRSINADHKDLIHDVAYDFYGRRMATCSSDQSVKVLILLSITFVNCHVVIIPFHEKVLIFHRCCPITL